MSQVEQRAGLAIFGQQNEAMGYPEMARFLEKRHSLLDDAEVQSALREGGEAFRRRVRDRLLSQHADQIFVNHCPTCRGVALTPLAKQCWWCGHDWPG